MIPGQLVLWHKVPTSANADVRGPVRWGRDRDMRMRGCGLQTLTLVTLRSWCFDCEL
jgi:hypothetical protein